VDPLRHSALSARIFTAHFFGHAKHRARQSHERHPLYHQWSLRACIVREGDHLTHGMPIVDVHKDIPEKWNTRESPGWHPCVSICIWYSCKRTDMRQIHLMNTRSRRLRILISLMSITYVVHVRVKAMNCHETPSMLRSWHWWM